MIAYVDASVLLRVALRQGNALPEWRQVERGVASALILTESLRTLDRLRLRASLSDEEVATRRATILRLVASMELVELDEVVLEGGRAADANRTGNPGRPASRHRRALAGDVARRSRHGDARHGAGAGGTRARLSSRWDSALNHRRGRPPPPMYRTPAGRLSLVGNSSSRQDGCAPPNEGDQALRPRAAAEADRWRGGHDRQPRDRPYADPTLRAVMNSSEVDTQPNKVWIVSREAS
jgi:predicted nucleic acid-binding protein